MPKITLTEPETVTVRRTREEKKQKENDRKREQKERKAARRELTTTDVLTSSAVPVDDEIPIPIPVPHSPPPTSPTLFHAPTDIPPDSYPAYLEARSAHVIPAARISPPDAPQSLFDNFSDSLFDQERNLITADDAESTLIHLLERALQIGWDAGVTFGFSVGKEEETPEGLSKDENVKPVREFSTAEIQTDSAAVIIPLQDLSPLIVTEDPIVQPMVVLPRDLTVLRTGISRPFGTLQRRLARSRHHLRHAQKKIGFYSY